MKLGAIFASASLFLFVAVQAQASIEYTIKKGDTPAVIAKKYHVSISDLQKANKLNPKKLKPGDVITIPSAKDQQTVRAKKQSEKKSKNDKTAKGKQAQNSKEAVSAAKDRPTAKAKQPQDNGEASPAKNDREPAPASKQLLSGELYHTVKKGDTLASISKKYSISVGDIKELNNLKNTRLKNGRRLLVKHMGPKTYTVKKGDNINKIAKKFNMDVDDLREINELESNDLKVGQKLYLEERVENEVPGQYSQIISKNVEEEIKTISKSEEFAEKPLQDKLTIFARKLINIPYKFGGNSIFGIDCSAYVKKVYGFMGIDLPRTAREQFKEGEEIAKDELSIGDLVFFRTYASFPSHVGIYLGNNLFIHASSKGRKVTIDSLEAPYYLKRFIGAKRLLTEESREGEPSS